LFEYPGMDAHVRAHRGFAKRVKSMKDSAVQRDDQNEVTAFLQDWIVNHIMTSDKKISAFLFQPVNRNPFARKLPT
jgi:hemerythrin-like metal-binding protein